jgi:imidazole glycerol-phosphate synthase subunit HisH
MITIVDYGTSNLGSMTNMLRKIGQPSRIASAPDQLEDATKIILPGVGSFDAGMKKLVQSGMVPVLNRKVIDERVPTLGVCLGMHLMTRGSEEGELPGLGWLAAATVRFDQVAEPNLRVPHMGWNEVHASKDSVVTADMADETRFYFAHSYFVRPDDPADILLEARYGASSFAAALARDNIVAGQFHPEKSHRFGMWLLKNFAERF